MSDELFPVADVTHESPRLAWLKRHGVITFLSLPNDPEYRLWMAGLRRWTTEFTDCNATPENIEPFDFFFHETGHNGDYRMGYGDTEHEAIASLAKRERIPLWNEEEFASMTAQKRENEKP